MKTFAEMQASELVRSRLQYGKMSSLHEGASILREEYEEFWDEVKLKQHSKERLVTELIQVAAVAQCIAEDLCGVSKISEHDPHLSDDVLNELLMSLCHECAGKAEEIQKSFEPENEE